MLLPLLTGGEITLSGVPVADLHYLCQRIKDAGASISVEDEQITIRHSGDVSPVSVVTAPHPGFPTDMQAQWMSVMSLATGTSTITEQIFENRFMHVPELQRLGAKISTNGRLAQVEGVASLQGATVMATDLRASASLVLAGLAANGQTEVLRVYHLDRGYSKLVQKLQGVGANIGRFPDHQRVEL